MEAAGLITPEMYCASPHPIEPALHLRSAAQADWAPAAQSSLPAEGAASSA
jgi:hypothetical protein